MWTIPIEIKEVLKSTDRLGNPLVIVICLFDGEEIKLVGLLNGNRLQDKSLSYSSNKDGDSYSELPYRIKVDHAILVNEYLIKNFDNLKAVS